MKAWKAGMISFGTTIIIGGVAGIIYWLNSGDKISQSQQELKQAQIEKAKSEQKNKQKSSSKTSSSEEETTSESQTEESEAEETTAEASSESSQVTESESTSEAQSTSEAEQETDLLDDPNVDSQNGHVRVTGRQSGTTYDIIGSEDGTIYAVDLGGADVDQVEDDSLAQAAAEQEHRFKSVEEAINWALAN
ncbi:hypothetical protein [Ligilactobacillus apodemi]|uniref:Uncharacterized protein n=1 Tax=Ligilactobacillus apodemi DSM 16634 = JCM 16172 TaxID=1423724 RepID=A0A0R1TUA1_9LACO|nr:hypothetical protein [Ligilactobacillus apodemi]KRL83828.1 hypothetical protein FC32_GL001092 [Ligilactobacillus apodemi DSM 16634 = JCM 16172]MCR1900681.1 hypothetical protein [Ligilactobacillus apodemi]